MENVSAPFEIAFLPHFSENAQNLFHALQDRGFLEQLEANDPEAIERLREEFGVEVRGTDEPLIARPEGLSDEEREERLTELQEVLGRIQIDPKSNPRDPLSWCKIGAIASAASEAAPG